MTASSFDPADLARRLIRARKAAVAVPHAHVPVPDTDGAYAVQDATVRGLGPVGGWKVGAKAPLAEPACAPLPDSGLFASGATLLGPQWRMRGIEVEVAVRLGRDLDPAAGEPEPALVRDAVEAVLPVIEVVETRLADWRDSAPLAQLADLQNHGGLVIGVASALSPGELDLRTVEAYLAFDGQPVASTRGANPAADVWRLLGWLARHCARRGQPLRAGDLITTGSCTGMLFAPEGAHVQAQLAGIGVVELWF
ncbi:MAG TPA: fumarylacetoacetate hydrolase family protein [Ramlibacter sp.]|nr:fumarylacetoacetate hydrolase family protein [Ramlibacter sp.]